MGMAVFLAECVTESGGIPSQGAMIQHIYEAVKGVPAGGLRWILILSIISLVGILWLVHRQYRLARNQVKIAAMLEDMAEKTGK